MSDRKPEDPKLNPDAVTAAVRSPSSSAVTIGAGFYLTPVLSSGTVLANRYEVLELLGQGGMGAVYKVFDRELDRFVALKTIRPDLAGYEEILQRFKQELILARQVAHRNIVRLYDMADDKGVKFITMEYIEGEDFRAILRRQGKFTPEEAIEVIRQICLALQAAHSEGVIHRDLKPQNILRDKQGRVVVMDFGLARALESNGMTQTGAMLGTMEYMSPEQAKGEVVDTTSDIYTAGLIFYELLTGKMPFAAESALASLMMRAQQRATPVMELEKGIPKHLSAIVSHCIEPDRRKRYQSASEILGDLEALSPSAMTQFSKIVPRRKETSHHYKWLSVALAVIVVLAGGFGAWKYAMNRANVQHAPVSVLVADFENHTGDPVFDSTLEPMLNAALEGASFVNAYSRGEARKIASQLPNHEGTRLDEQTARLVAASQSIGAVVTGSLSRRGDGYRISLEAMNGLSGTEIASAETTVASKEEVTQAIPKLAAPIRRALGDKTPESVQLAESQGSFKVGSLEAAHQYGLGMEQQFSGKLKDALQSFKKSAELDADFGRAYSGIAATSRNLGDRETAEQNFKQALQHVETMTERERYRTRGAYYLFSGNYPKCVDEYSALVSQYPADNIGHSNLAACYARLRNMPRAVVEARRASNLSPNGLVQRLNLSLFSTYAGDFAAGEREAREVLKSNSSFEQAYLTLADAQVGQGRIQEAKDTYRQLNGISPSGASLAKQGLGEIAILQGHYTEAERILTEGVATDLAAKDNSAAADKYMSMARAFLSAERHPETIAAAEKALTYDQRANLRFLVARVMAQAGATDKASQIAATLGSEPLIEPQTYAKIINGLVSLRSHQTAQAIQSFSDANRSLDTWVGHFDLGRAYLEAGQFTEANSEFDICVRRRGEALELLDDGPTYGFLPPTYFYQGKALAGLKSRGADAAMQSYVSMRGESKEDPRLLEAQKLIKK